MEQGLFLRLKKDKIVLNFFVEKSLELCEVHKKVKGMKKRKAKYKMKC